MALPVREKTSFPWRTVTSLEGTSPAIAEFGGEAYYWG